MNDRHANEPTPDETKASRSWPILVARGYDVGYRVILAPTFLIEHQLTALIMRATALLPEEDSAQTFGRLVTGWQVEDFVVFFRKQPASPSLVGREGTYLHDQGSRPIYLTKGLAQLGTNTFVSESLLEKASGIAESAFVSFWMANDPSSATLASAELADEPEPGGGDVLKPIFLSSLERLVDSGPSSPPSFPPQRPAIEQPPAPGISDQRAVKQKHALATGAVVAAVVVGAIILLAFLIL